MAESQTLARPYSDAAFKFAQEGNDLAGWADMLNRLSSVLGAPEARSLLESPNLAATTVAETIADAAGQLNEPQRNFIQLLAQNDRLGVMPQIREQFDTLRARHEGTLQAVIVSAFALEPSQVDDIVATLAQRYGKQVKADVEVDPDLIGGVAIRIGDEVIDASVRGKLAQLASSLKS